MKILTCPRPVRSRLVCKYLSYVETYDEWLGARSGDKAYKYLSWGVQQALHVGRPQLQLIGRLTLLVEGPQRQNYRYLKQVQ